MVVSRSCDVHGVDPNEALPDSAFAQGLFYLGGDVFEAALPGEIEPKFFTIGFHDDLLLMDIAS
jgi:hypothetical protein